MSIEVSSLLDPERCTNHHKPLALTNTELCMSVRHALLLYFLPQFNSIIKNLCSLKGFFFNHLLPTLEKLHKEK